MDAHDNMHSSIQDTIDVLSHSLEQASHCPAHMKRKAIQLIGDCVEVLRQWTEQEPFGQSYQRKAVLSTDILDTVQVFRACDVQKRVNTCLAGLPKLKEVGHPANIVHSRPDSPDGCTCEDSVV